MPLFISDDELERHANNASLVAEKADCYIRDLQRQLETLKAQADAASITAEQSCALVEQKYISISSEFSKLQHQNSQLSTSLDQSLAELAQVQAEKHQLNLKAISKDGEIERLSMEAMEIRKSKRQLMELMEQKDLEINEKNGTLKSYLDKIVKLTDDANLKEARLHDIKAELARSLAACSRLSQEKELVERHNVWLNEELTSKVNSLTELRRSHSEFEAEMSAKLADVEKQFNGCSSSLKWNTERVRELEAKLISAQEELCSAKDVAAANEEHFSAEVVTASKLVELYKESTEEWSRKAGELEGVIKALETHLSQVEDEYKEKLDNETSARKALEKEAADLKEKLDKCEHDMEHARKANELSLLQVVTLQSDSSGEETWIGGGEADKVSERDKMLVPKVLSGVSGTALAASLLRDGWSLAKIYAKYQESVDALRHEQMGRKQSQAILERVLYEIQEKAEVIMDERAEHERMVEAYTLMNQKLQQSLAEQANYESTIRELKVDLRRHERDYRIAQKEIHDLEKQVTVLLKECRDIQLRCGAGNHVPDINFSTLRDVGLEEGSDADRVISERLLTFKDINGLVEQNVQLRSLVRDLASQNDQKEAELQERSEIEIRKHDDEAAAKVAAVLKRSEEQAQMIESLCNSVGMYRRLYEDELKTRASLPEPSEAIPEDGRKDLMHLLEGSQEASKRASEQVAQRAKSLEEEVAKARSEVISLRLERDKLSLEANFTRERLDSIIKESDHQRDRVNEIRARNVEFSQLIIDYQRRLRESSHSIQASEEQSRKFSMEVSVLKHERDILLSSERRASDEVRSLSERVHRLQATLDTIHSAEEVHEESRAMERRKLEQELKRMEREWAEAKQELQDERDHIRTLTHEREQTIQNSMRQVEEMRKELTDALHAIAAAEARAAVSEARCSDLQAKLKSSETKVGEKDLGFDNPVCPVGEVTIDQQKAEEEIESLKEEVQAYKNHMLQFKEIAQVNEDALKQIASAHENFKAEAEKMRNSLETEIHLLRGRISELESDALVKSLEVGSALAEKEDALSSALLEIVELKDENSVNRSQVEEMEIRISSLKEDLEKEHQRWRTAQNNYERQVLLQSETIQELKKTSQELAVLQDETSELHKSVDTLKSENGLLKATWESEKLVLEESKKEAERKFTEVNEQNNILLNRLEALHIKLAEKERNLPGVSSITSSPDSQGERDLENVIKYLRRSKTIAETEISLLKQEQLRQQTNLERALKASELAQAALQAERANSRAVLFTEEEFMSLQLQVQEMNLLRESNMQLREENKYNFEESQKFCEVAQKANAEIERLGSLLREKDIEVDAYRKEIQTLKTEIGHWENRVSKLQERCKNVDAEDYYRMKEEFQQIQEKLREKEAEIVDTKKFVSEKEQRISNLEQDLAKKQLEQTELEKRIQEIAQVEETHKIELEKQKKLVLQWKRRVDTLTKEKEELNKEKQTLSKLIEDSKSSKRSIGESAKQHESMIRQELIAQHEQALKEKEKEKDTRIQILEKTLEREREELRKEREENLKGKLRRNKDRKAFLDLAQKAVQEKKKLFEELEMHKQAKDNLSENSSLSTNQLPSETDLEDKTAAYILAVDQLEEAANSTLNDGPGVRSVSIDASHADTSSAPNDAKTGRVVSDQSLIPSQVKPVEEREQRLNLPKLSTEARKTGRKLIRPRLETSQEPIGDAEMTEMDGVNIPEEGPKLGGPPHDSEPSQLSALPLPSTSAKKRQASSSASELLEENITQQETGDDVAPPLPKKSRGSDSPQLVAEEPSGNTEKLPGMDDLSEVAGDAPHGSEQEVVGVAKDEDIGTSTKQIEDPKERLDSITEAESQTVSNVIVREELMDKPTGDVEEPCDGGEKGNEVIDEKHSPVLESEGGGREGELVADLGELQEGADMILEEGEANSELFLGGSVADTEEASVADAGNGVEITSPEVLNEDVGGFVEEATEGSDGSNNNNDSGPADVEQSSHATAVGSASEVPHDVAVEGVVPKQEGSSTVAETEENEQQGGRNTTTILINERARQRALLRQAGMVSPPLTRGRGRTRDGGRGGRGGRAARRLSPGDMSEG